jgi:hypothetical protein
MHEQTLVVYLLQSFDIAVPLAQLAPQNRTSKMEVFNLKTLSFCTSIEGHKGSKPSNIGG